MPDLTKSGLLNALKKTDDANLEKNLLTLNNIKEFNITDDKLDLSITLPLPSNEISKELKNKIINTLKSDFPSINKINLDLQGKTRTHNDSQKNTLLPGVKNTIAVASGKGGVGKSTIAVNLAVALAKDGASVGLIDADIYGPSIPLMLGIKEKPKVYQDKATMRMIPLENYGIKVISIGFLVDENAPVIWRGPMASGAVKQFMTDVEWGELDYLIFDMPPGTGDIQLTLVQTVPLTGSIIVTTPQEVSLIDARKALKMFTRVNVPVLGVIENMSYFIAPDTGKKYDIFGIGGGSNLAKELNVPFLGGLPIDSKIRQGGDKGVPIVYDEPGTEHEKVMIEISRNLGHQIDIINSNPDSNVEISLDDE
ncbi:MAG TPA: iron-sulfur cluster carrier protein ApbC [Ignavibacteriaceae bacterium]|nr:iron-sulfur cluster carrier protein ApbC [Ignavibacteriaceae bacterium]